MSDQPFLSEKQKLVHRLPKALQEKYLNDPLIHACVNRCAYDGLSYIETLEFTLEKVSDTMQIFHNKIKNYAQEVGR